MRIDPGAIYKKYQTASKSAKQTDPKVGKASLALFKEGSVLKGQIMDAHLNKVMIQLENGETIEAKIAGDGAYSIGESVAFVVKESAGDQLLITSLMDSGTQGEEQLLSILGEAGLAKSEENVEMVKAMIHKSLPIDQESLKQMSRLMTKYPDTPVKDLVFLTKHQIPVTETSIQQLQMLETNDQPLMRSMASLVDDLSRSMARMSEVPQVLSNHEGVAVQDQETSLMSVISEDQEALAFIKALNQQITTLSNDINKSSSEALVTTTEAKEVSLAITETPSKPVVNLPPQLVQLPIDQMVMAKDSPPLHESLESMVLAKGEATVLTTEQQSFLEQLPQTSELTLANVFEMAEVELISRESLREFMVTLKEASTYQTLAKGLLLSDLKVIEDGEVNEWFNKVQDKVQELANEPNENFVTSQVAKGAVEVKNTLDFMNNLQQDYQFMQLPMFLNDQLLSSEFYVMNKSKASKERGQTTTALVRLDLVNLGHTDIYIKKVDKNIDVQFFMTDESQISVMQEHVFELHKLLKDKGFNTLSATVQALYTGFDIVNDFLDKDEGSVSSQRYSFDMRA